MSTPARLPFQWLCTRSVVWCAWYFYSFDELSRSLAMPNSEDQTTKLNTPRAPSWFSFGFSMFLCQPYSLTALLLDSKKIDSAKSFFISFHLSVRNLYWFNGFIFKDEAGCYDLKFSLLNFTSTGDRRVSYSGFICNLLRYRHLFDRHLLKTGSKFCCVYSVIFWYSLSFCNLNDHR